MATDAIRHMQTCQCDRKPPPPPALPAEAVHRAGHRKVGFKPGLPMLFGHAAALGSTGLAALTALGELT